MRVSGVREWSDMQVLANQVGVHKMCIHISSYRKYLYGAKKLPMLLDTQKKTLQTIMCMPTW